MNFSNLAQVIRGDDITNVPQNTLDNSVVIDAVRFVSAAFAAVAVLIIAISAFRIIISRGNSDDVSKARDAIIYAAIGLIISLSAFAIVSFVIRRV